MSSQIADEHWVPLSGDGNIYPYYLGQVSPIVLAQGFTIDDAVRILYNVLCYTGLSWKEEEKNCLQVFQQKNRSYFSIQHRDKTDVFCTVSTKSHTEEQRRMRGEKGLLCVGRGQADLKK